MGNIFKDEECDTAFFKMPQIAIEIKANIDQFKQFLKEGPDYIPQRSRKQLESQFVEKLHLAMAKYTKFIVDKVSHEVEELNSAPIARLIKLIVMSYTGLM